MIDVLFTMPIFLKLHGFFLFFFSDKYIDRCCLTTWYNIITWVNDC